MVDISLVLSQLSFCCTYVIFIYQNVPRALPRPPPGSLADTLLTPDALTLLQVMSVAADSST